MGCRHGQRRQTPVHAHPQPLTWQKSTTKEGGGSPFAGIRICMCTCLPARRLSIGYSDMYAYIVRVVGCVRIFASRGVQIVGCVCTHTKPSATQVLIHACTRQLCHARMKPIQYNACTSACVYKLPSMFIVEGDLAVKTGRRGQFQSKPCPCRTETREETYPV